MDNIETDLNNFADYILMCKNVCDTLGIQLANCAYGSGLNYYTQNCLYNLPDYLVRKLDILFKEFNVR